MSSSCLAIEYEEVIADGLGRQEGQDIKVLF